MKLSGRSGKLSVVSASGLIALKQLRGSGQDLADIEALRGEGLEVKQVDMSAKAVTARLRRVSRCAALVCLLQKAKLPVERESYRNKHRATKLRQAVKQNTK